MKATECVPQRISKAMLGFLALAGALAFFVLGITLLPVFGILLALPMLALAIYIFRLHLNKQCEIDLTAE